MDSKIDEFDTKDLTALPAAFSLKKVLNYSPLTDPEYIRVLRISPDHSDEIVVSLEEIALSGNIPYECLSYTWDGPTFGDTGEEWTSDRKHIVCNGSIIFIRQNLYDCLVELRKVGIVGPIWIDALCINQNDINERNKQVGMMGRIYKNATRVIVWLGREDEHTELAVSSLKRIRLTAAECLRDESIVRREYARCNFTKRERIAILHFIKNRRWCNRLWTVQETVLARDLVFICGSNIASADMVCCGSLFADYNREDFFDIWITNSPSMQNSTGLRSFLEVLKVRDLNQQSEGSPPPFANVVHAFRDLQTSDPRDKIYAVLGISDCHHDELSSTMTANYDVLVQDLYIDAARYALHTYSHIEALSKVGEPSKQKINDLPSWVPDLSVSLTTLGLEEEKDRFATDGSQNSLPILEIMDKVLVLNGHEWDRVVARSGTIGDLGDVSGIAQLLKTFKSDHDMYFGSMDTREVAVRRLLITDRLIDVAHASDSYNMEAAFERLFFALLAFALKASEETTLLRLFLEDPKAAFKRFGVPDSYDWLSEILVRGKENWEFQKDNWMKNLETIPSNFAKALDIIDDPYALSWARYYSNRRYFRK
ncbi:HET-domain-containing protein [Mollisia scopiformis]|uniref:HET-domain-containing protein n=1 Tax=Mollisia scopiformis TaxID=149040 RepID=A0A194XHM7_MOLSC|nr:HET-domain-containing protein [Mollisia scopiformis]KUJ19634.1 HET-domain-containing protein [Mollisia scopiformis]